jgi:small GTP-binding protein
MRSSHARFPYVPVAAVFAALVGVGLVGWTSGLPDRDNWAFWGCAVALLIASAAALGYVAVRARNRAADPRQSGQDEPSTVDDPGSMSRQEEQARLAIDKLSGERARRALNRSLAELRSEQDRREFRVVVFGTGSAGKTSLINAVLGRQAGATDPIMGTTKRGEIHTEVVEGVEGTLLLTDTPGLSEFGREGETREREATELAESADLILFVLDHDLIRAELDVLVRLAALRKRLIVVFNKTDRFTDEDRAAVLAKLRERLHGTVAAEDIVAVAASPRPIPVRVVQPDGSTEIHYEPEEPDVAELEDRIARILEREGPALRAGNLLLRARRLERMAAEELIRERRARALAVIEKYQWITAASIFASPVAAINLATGGAAQYQMVNELTRVFGVESSPSRGRAISAQMMATLLKLGLGEAATTLIAGLFKSSLFGFAAAGAVQAVTMAYLTRVSGLAFIDYFENGQNWGEGGISANLLRQFDATSRTEFLQDFIKLAVQKLADRAGLHPAPEHVGERGS